jgi:methylphosphotriester-DNA--protein-cysteine methyltransferase
MIGCTDIQSCIQIIEPYFLHLLRNKRQEPSAVSQLADLINCSRPAAPVLSLYEKLPLTPRQLERNFTKEIGLPPKKYSAMVRFENLLRQRIQNPNRKWTDLAYELDYFDQMHMIRDFHKFLDINPNHFKAENFAL